MDPDGQSVHIKRVKQPPDGAEYTPHQGALNHNTLKYRKSPTNEGRHPNRIRDGMG